MKLEQTNKFFNAQLRAFLAERSQRSSDEPPTIHPSQPNVWRNDSNLSPVEQIVKTLWCCGVVLAAELSALVLLATLVSEAKLQLEEYMGRQEIEKQEIEEYTALTQAFRA